MAKKFKFDGLIKEAEKQKAAAEKNKIQGDDEIKQDIVIKEEFENFIPPLTEAEYARLEENILAEGCRDPLVLWKNEEVHILIDGHNRYGICSKHHLDFKIEIKTFVDKDEVKDWMIANQLGKRNVTEETKSYLRGVQYNREKQKGANIQNLKQFSEEDNLTFSGKTADRLAEQHKVSEKTIKRDEKFAIAVNKITQDQERLKWAILNKKILVPKGSMMKLANEKEEIAKKIGGFLLQGISFKKSVEKATIVSAQENEINPEEQHLKKLKNEMIACINEAIKSKDLEAVEELKELVEKLEGFLGNI